MTIEELRDLKIGDRVKVNTDLYLKNTYMRSIKKGFVSPVYLIDVVNGRVGILGSIVDYFNLDVIKD